MASDKRDAERFRALIEKGGFVVAPLPISGPRRNWKALAFGDTITQDAHCGSTARQALDAAIKAAKKS